MSTVRSAFALAVILIVFAIKNPVYAQDENTTSLPTIRAEGEESPMGGVSPAAEDLEFSRDIGEELVDWPNIQRAGGSHRSRFFQIRGLGDRGQFEHSQVNPIGVFFEGMDLSEEASVLPLLGQEKLQVFYGPQTQSWGSKAVAGSIEVDHCLPHCDNARVGFSTGSFKTHTAKAEMAVKAESSFTLGVKALTSEGVYHNAYLDRPTHTQNEKTLLAGGEHSLGRFQVRHFHFLTEHKNGYDAWTFDRSFKTLSDHPGSDRHQVQAHSLKLSERGGSRFSSLSSLTSTRQLESYDEDWGNNPYWQRVAAQDYNYYSEFERERLKFHQKFNYENSDFLKFKFHYYYYEEDQNIWSFKEENLRKSAKPESRSHQWALGSEKTWFWGDFQLLGALRAETQHVELKQASIGNRDNEFNLWGALLQLDQTLSEQIGVSYLIQRAYRGGGFNTDPNLNDRQRPFGSEVLYQFENRWFMNFENLRLTARAFYYWYKDQQVRSSYQVDPEDPSTFTYYTSNVGESELLGSELGVIYPLNAFEIQFTGGLLQSKYLSYDLAGRNLKGRDLPHAPRWNYQARLSYIQDRLETFVSYRRNGGFYFSEDHDQKAKAFGVVDLGFNFNIGHWQWSAWAKNLLDENYVTRGYFFANEPPAWEDKLYVKRGGPQSFGVGLLYRFE